MGNRKLQNKGKHNKIAMLSLTMYFVYQKYNSECISSERSKFATKRQNSCLTFGTRKSVWNDNNMSPDSEAHISEYSRPSLFGVHSFQCTV